MGSEPIATAVLLTAFGVLLAGAEGIGLIPRTGH
jgi:hypothetical protein